MNRPEPDYARTDALIAEINALRPLADVPPEQWIDLGRLDEILAALWEAGTPERATTALFQLLERFPNYEDNGVFWSVLHGLEELPNCGEELIASVRRVPVEFNLTMVNRFLNGGETRIGDTDLMELLRETAARTDIDAEARKDAQEYIEYQEKKGK